MKVSNLSLLHVIEAGVGDPCFLLTFLGAFLVLLLVEVFFEEDGSDLIEGVDWGCDWVYFSLAFLFFVQHVFILLGLGEVSEVG